MLNLAHIPERVKKGSLRDVLTNAKLFVGVDASSQQLPVAPTSHYNMGGIPTNAHTQVQLSVKFS